MLPSTFGRQDMRQFLRVCCKKLPFGPLPRSREGGHFQTRHPTLQRQYFREAWRSGIADMTWKCWACLAHSTSLDYDEFAGIYYRSKYTPGFKRQRTAQRVRHEPGAPSSAAMAQRYSPEAVEAAREARLYEVLCQLEADARWRT